MLLVQSASTEHQQHPSHADYTDMDCPTRSSCKRQQKHGYIMLHQPAFWDPENSKQTIFEATKIGEAPDTTPNRAPRPAARLLHKHSCHRLPTADCSCHHAWDVWRSLPLEFYTCPCIRKQHWDQWTKQSTPYLAKILTKTSKTHLTKKYT